MIIEVYVREETHRVYHIEAESEDEARKKVSGAIIEGDLEKLKEMESEHKEFHIETPQVN